MHKFNSLFTSGSALSSHRVNLVTPIMTEENDLSLFEETLSNASYVEFFLEKILEPLNKRYSSQLFEDDIPVLEEKLNFDRWASEINDLCEWSHQALSGDGEAQWENLRKITNQFGKLTQLKLKITRQTVQAPANFIEAVKHFSVIAMIIALILETINNEVENNKHLQEEFRIESDRDEAQDSISKMYVSPQKKRLESDATQMRKAISKCSVVISGLELQIEAELSLEEEQRYSGLLEDLTDQLDLELAALDIYKQEIEKIASEANVYNRAKEQLAQLAQKKKKIAGENLRDTRNEQIIRFQDSRTKGIELIKNNADIFLKINFSKFFIQCELASISSAMINEYLNDCSSGMQVERKALLLTYIKPRLRNLALAGIVGQHGGISQLSLRDSHNQIMHGFVIHIFSSSMRLNEPLSITNFGENILNIEDSLAQQCVNMIEEHAERQKAIRRLKVDLSKVLSRLSSTKVNSKKYQQESFDKNKIGEQLFFLDEEDQAVSAQIFFIKYAVQKALFKRGVFNDNVLERKTFEQFGLDNRKIIFLSNVNFLLKLHYFEENISDEMATFDEGEQENRLSHLIPGMLRVIRNVMSNLSHLPSMMDDYFSRADSINFIEDMKAISSEQKVQLALIFTITVMSRLFKNLWRQSEEKLKQASRRNGNAMLFEKDAGCFEKLTHFFSDLQNEVGVSFDEINGNFIFILGADFLACYGEVLFDGSCLKSDGIELCDDTHFSQYRVKSHNFEAFFKTSVWMIGFLRFSEEKRKHLIEHQDSRAVIQSVVIASATSHRLKRLLIADYLRQWHIYQVQAAVFEAPKDNFDLAMESQKIITQVAEQENHPVSSSFITRKWRSLFYRPSSTRQGDSSSDDSDDSGDRRELREKSKSLALQKALESIECTEFDGGGEYELVSMSRHIAQYQSFEPEKKSFYALVNQAYVDKISENTIANLVVHGQTSHGTLRALQQLLKSEKICLPPLGDEYSVQALRGLYYLLCMVTSSRFSRVLGKVVMKQWAIDLKEIKKIYGENIFGSQVIICDSTHIPEVLPILLALQAAVLVFYDKQLIMPGSEISQPYFSANQMNHACQGNWFLKLRFIQEAIAVPVEQVFIIKLLKVIQNAFDHLLHLSDIISNFFDTADSTEVRNTISTMPAYQRIKLALLMLVSFLYTTVNYLHIQVGAHNQKFDVTWLLKVASFFEEIMQEARFVYDKNYQGTVFELVKMLLIAVKDESHYLLLEGASFAVQEQKCGKEITVSDCADNRGGRSIRTARPNASSFYYYPGSIRLLGKTIDRRAENGTRAFIKAVLENPVEDALMEAQIRHYSLVASRKISF